MMGLTFLAHLTGPDAGLNLPYMGPVQKQHAQAGLADAAADGIGQFMI